MTKARYRVTHTFQLDLERTVDAMLNDALPNLIRRKRKTPMIRNGLHVALLFDEAERQLEQGEHVGREHLQVLENLYPKAFRDMMDRHHAAELERLQRELKELQQRVEMSGVQLPPVKERVGAVESADDIQITTVKPTNIGKNFFSKLKAMNK